MDPSLSLIVREYHADPARARRVRLGLDTLDPLLLDDIGADDRQRWVPKRPVWGWLTALRPATFAALVLPQPRSARRA